jgi:hypothetical protein
MSRILTAFDVYTQKLNWEVIPVLPNSKAPLMKGWNKHYDLDQVRKYLEENPDSNIGLRLGSVIDVEADTDYANTLLNEKVKDYPHPMYQSEKSIHHLFLTPDNELTRFVIHGMEFRGKLHQSLLPPSVNSNGVYYTWCENSSFPIPPLPDSLVNLYNKHMKMAKAVKSGNLVKPLCYSCGKSTFHVHKTRYKLECLVFGDLGQKWQCQRCRDNKIRKLCRKIKRSRLTNVR